MRSKTLLTLSEFCSWVGGDPWAFAGIDLYDDDAPLHGDIALTAQYARQRMPNSTNDSTYAGSNSRQMVEQAILKAERLFFRWTNRYPVPVNILAEKHNHPSVFDLRYGTVVPTFKPKVAEVRSFGVWVLEEASMGHSVSKLDGGDIADIFSMDAVPVPDNTLAQDVHVYLNKVDGNYSGLPQLQHEIRPLRCTIDASGGSGNWVAHLEGDAYLFVLPELYEIDPPEGIEHEAASYLATVDVYTKSVDSCQQGRYIVPNPCNALPCPEPSMVLACWKSEGRGHYSPMPVTCNEGIMQKSKLGNWPSEVEMNYIAGAALDNRFVNEQMLGLISQLALGFLPFDEESLEDFPTTPLWTGTARYYRALQTWETGFDMVAPQVGIKKALAVPPHLQHLINGLEPRRGFVQSLGEIMEMAWLVQTYGSTHK